MKGEQGLLVGWQPVDGFCVILMMQAVEFQLRLTAESSQACLT